MTFSALEAAVARFSYREGWRFSVHLDEFLGPYLRIIAPVANGYDPRKRVDLGIDCRLPPGALRSAEGLKEWLLWRLIEVEVHECREFLRYDGELVSDPHAELRSTCRSQPW
jgi:hypothetical protein